MVLILGYPNDCHGSLSRLQLYFFLLPWRLNPRVVGVGEIVAFTGALAYDYHHVRFALSVGAAFTCRNICAGNCAGHLHHVQPWYSRTALVQNVWNCWLWPDPWHGHHAAQGAQAQPWPLHGTVWADLSCCLQGQSKPQFCVYVCLCVCVCVCVHACVHVTKCVRACMCVYKL